ncbi:MAG: thioesterase family protein [Sphingomonadales bacterium]|nr:thioesterase family protein [Sphingomonadales bacterium]MBU3993130.1 thioesterase family protein [Alphaproteobacteria bacterium]
MSTAVRQLWGTAADLVRLLDVQPGGADTYTAPPHPGAPRNVVEGSQMLAQSVVAASKAVPDKRVISAHALFSRVARFDAPLAFRTDVLRNGRGFATVEVRTEQDGKLCVPALLLLDKGAPDTISGQIAMPAVPAPEECPSYDDFGMPGREVRFVGGDYAPTEDRIGPPELYCWVRYHEDPGTPVLHQALLTQFTGHMTIAAAMLPHEGMMEAAAHVTLSTGVLGITVAYHADVDVTDWLLFANPSTFAGRGLVQGQGHVFTRAGKLVASYAVQAMIRGFDRPVGELNAAQLL